MLASEARQLAGKQYETELNIVQRQILERAKGGFFSVVVQEPISDYVLHRLQDDGYALSKTQEWYDLVSW